MAWGRLGGILGWVMDMKVLVSACLMGVGCRYDGRACEELRLPEGVEAVPFCPEVYGGLTTPRPPAEIVGGRVLTREGADVTEAFVRGAEEAARLCQRMGIRLAVLKDKSPSCGAGWIHDGKFGGGLVEGWGYTARRLREIGCRVVPASKAEAFWKTLDGTGDMG